MHGRWPRETLDRTRREVHDMKNQMKLIGLVENEDGL